MFFRKCFTNIQNAVTIPCLVAKKDRIPLLHFYLSCVGIKSRPCIYRTLFQRRFAIRVLERYQFNILFAQIDTCEGAQQKNMGIGTASDRYTFSLEILQSRDAGPCSCNESGPFRIIVDVDRFDGITVRATQQGRSTRCGSEINTLTAKQLERFVTAETLSPLNLDAVILELLLKPSFVFQYETKRIVISPIELDRGNMLFGASTRRPEKKAEDNRYEDQFYSKFNDRCRFHRFSCLVCTCAERFFDAALLWINIELSEWADELRGSRRRHSFDRKQRKEELSHAMCLFQMWIAGENKTIDAEASVLSEPLGDDFWIADQCSSCTAANKSDTSPEIWTNLQ